MDRPTLETVLQDLHTTFGFGVHLYDQKCRGIAHYTGESSFCRLIHTNNKTEAVCRHFDEVGFRTAAELRDVYTARCPFGIYNAICPICNADEILGYLMVSRVISDTPTAMEATMQIALRYLPNQTAALSSAIQALPQRTEAQLDAIPTILRCACQYIAQNDLFPTETLTLGALAKCYIRHNLQSRLTLQEISDHLHYSKSTLTNAFRRETGMTVVTYINKERLKLSCSLLVSSNLSISAIAQDCGYASVEYFSNLFKKEYGCSPLSYRKLHKKAEA